jgi:putative membrane protein
MFNRKITLATACMLTLTAHQSWAAMSKDDLTFLQKATSCGLAEVALGRMTQQNAQSAQVKEFGLRMVADHGEANKELQKIAKSQKLDLPKTPTSEDKAAEDRLGALKGAEFDAAYSEDMVKDHQKDLAVFQHEAESGQDPALKAFAQKTLPRIQQHLQMAQAISARK